MNRMFGWILVALLLAGTVGRAQEQNVSSGVGGAAQQAAPTLSPESVVPLKVTLLLSRYQADKKISSMPYSLSVVAAPRAAERSSIRMGNQIPVPSTVFGKDSAVAVNSYSYRDVGTNIDCTANTTDGRSFKLLLTISDSSVYYPEENDPSARSMTASTRAPAFRSFSATFQVVLRDGQTSQYTSVTDQVTGQVTKVDVTVNVQK